MSFASVAGPMGGRSCGNWRREEWRSSAARWRRGFRPRTWSVRGGSMPRSSAWTRSRSGRAGFATAAGAASLPCSSRPAPPRASTRRWGGRSTTSRRRSGSSASAGWCSRSSTFRGSGPSMGSPRSRATTRARAASERGPPGFGTARATSSASASEWSDLRGATAPWRRPRAPPPRRLGRRSLLDGLGLGADHRAFARGVDDSLLEPPVATVEDSLPGVVVGAVVVGPQAVEQRLHPPTGLAAEEVGELAGLTPSPRLVGRNPPGIDARGCDREQLGADVDDPSEERLPLLERRLPAADPVEGRASELARAPLDEAQVSRQLCELLVGARPLSLADHQSG